MIRRFYVHNFRCFENFELPVSGLSSALLTGNNGSGKSTVGLALEVLQKIGRGKNRAKSLVEPKDFCRGRTDVPMRFEIEVELNARVYEYVVAFDFPEGFKELRVLEERLTVEPEALRTAGLGSYETIGRELARDCREDTDAIWRHDLLRHNASEVDRLRRHVRPILFQ